MFKPCNALCAYDKEMMTAKFETDKMISQRIIVLLDEILEQQDREDLLRTYDFNIASDRLTDSEETHS